MGFEYASRASKGARDYQEDAIAIHALANDGAVSEAANGSASRLAVVLADGMGGHAGGARASAIACGHFLAAYAQTQGETPQRLAQSLEIANLGIFEEVEANPALNGMGCTLVGTVFGADGIEWISVGDSPLFLVRKHEIVVLNEDHSLAPEIDKLAEAGKISWEEAQADPRRHFLRSALTGGDIELVDASVRPLALQAGDIVILSSDGIHTLGHDDIRDVAVGQAARGPAAIAEGLLEHVAARRQPYQDNTTIVVALVR
ncbi:MAG: protein phosphatase 2C domain-containing protein [Hyphomicrobiaceae bacterium]|nr:protein phosphatase 2C domain-containing protein [Hyphomicrobiaceae bacterium]